MVKVIARKRTVLGGAMDRQRVTVLHGSVMKHVPSGDEYRRYGDDWWVPMEDTDEDAARRVQQFRSQIAGATP